MEYVETGLEIAVIGMAGRFPGARNIEEFWDNLKNGIESISFLSDDELEGISPELRNNPDYVKAGGGILEDIEYFDASFFNYTPLEAEHMAPQSRIFHECAWTALEDAGYDPGFYNRLIALYIGISSSTDWEILPGSSSANGRQDTFASYYLKDRDFLSTLISYKLNLKGPAFSMNTTCSTSLVAIHLACQGLLSGDCDTALAGGIAIRFEDNKGYLYEEGMILSPDGHCRAFDGEAGGTIGGNGAGVVVLKRLEDAIKDRDNIYAVIKGSAVNNDGNRKVGYTAPSIEGQADVIRKAHKMAEVNPEDISYVETHGTATPLGDVTEVEALKLAFNTDKKHFCGLGSVKTNIGHLDVTAGAAGFIKTVLALKYHRIPPSLHFKTPNPKIDFENSPFYVNAALKEWKSSNKPLRAGVSSFGIGGTNAHVVLEEYTDASGGQGALFEKTAPWTPAKTFINLILLSAKTQSALDKMTENLARYLKNNPGLNPADAAYTLQVGRRHFACRRKLVGSGIAGIIEKLSSSNSRDTQSFLAETGEERKNIIFMFPGLGPQYVNMGSGLYQAEPVFREEMNRCFEILKPLGFDIKGILYPSSMSDIHQFEIAQLVVFIFEYALAKLLMYWGIKPRAMIGYSFGEYVSACLAGVFSLEDILRLLTARGKLISELPPGMMLSIPLPAEDVHPLIPAELSIGIDNGSSCVVSGPLAAIKLFEKHMKEKKLLCTPLESTHAIHSQMMDPILERFAEEVGKISLNPPQIPYISTVTGNWIRVEDAVSPAYWAKQLRAAVRFAGGIQQLLKETDTIFLEVGPGRDISALVNREIDDQSPHHAINLVRHPKKEIPDEYYLLDKIGLLWLYGVNIDWNAYYSGEKRNRISLPTYPFERQRFWKLVDEQKQKEAAPGKHDSNREQKRELSDCFYVLSWKQTLSPLSLHSHSTTANNRGWLIFLDDDECGLGKSLVNKLNQEQEGHKIVTVTRGKHFSEVREDHYIIDPANKGDYDSLVKNLLTKGKFPGLLVHLWGLGTEVQYDIDFYKKCQDDGYYSLLFLVQALVNHHIAKNLADMDDDTDSLQIEIVSNNLYAVTGEEKLAPERATILGLCKTIPQEYPNITCRSIDIGIPSSPPANESGLLDQLAAEFTTPCKDLTAAYRGKFRWVTQFEPLKLEAADGRPVRLRKKGVYLITGGLGNDSFIRSKYLAETLGARLALTGRTQLPEREYWRQYRMIHGDDDEIGIKIGRILELERLGAEVLPISADVSDQFDMRMVMQKIDTEFGELNGVIHAAGETGIESARLLAELGPEESEWHFKPKVYGLYVLEKVLNGRNLDFCLLTSSIASFTGGIGLSAYTAASIFMDIFARRHNQMSPVPWISLNWEGTSPEETAEAFTRVLSLQAVDQLLFSKTDLDRLVKERTGFKFITGDKQTGYPADREAAFLYSRPDLSTPYAAPRNRVEQELADIWQRFLGIEKIGITDDLFDLGGDSLKATNILSIIHKELKVNIPIKEFFDNPTIEGVAKYLTAREGAEEKKYVSIEPAEEKEYYLISSAQKRMYLFQQMNPDSIAYNTPMLRILEGDIDTGKLEDIFKKLIERHESLRTSIEPVNDEPVQKVYSEVEFEIEYYDEKLPTGFVRPFDLSKPPFMRVGLIKTNERESLLMLDMHHIIADAVSMGVLISEFIILYERKELPGLRVQYKDYAEWQDREMEREAIKQQEAFWLKEFGVQGELPVLDLPFDYLRPKVRDFAGSALSFEIDSEKIRALKTFALEEGATLFMVLLSIYNIFLSKLSQQEVVVVGTPTAGRHHADLEQVIGMFINTLTLKNYPSAEKKVREFLNEVKGKTLEAFSNQDYQYEDLVEKVMLNRDTSRNPLFDTMFMFQNLEVPGIEITGLKLKPYQYKQETSKFDLTLLCAESDETLSCTVEYSTELFKEETIQRFIKYLKNTISAVADNPDQKIWEIDILPEEEKKQLLMDFNDTAARYPEDKTIFQLFAHQVDKNPDHAALVFRDETVTFRDFDERANRLADYLCQDKGLRPGDRAAVLMERSVELIVSLMGVMKAGGAYVPLDPVLPGERLRVVFEDASIGVVISQGRFMQKLLPLQADCRDFHSLVCMDGEAAGIDKYSPARPGTGNAGDPAYVMYTSGSSGIPKGVLVEHRTIVNTLIWRRDFYEYQPGNVSLQIPPYFFDSSVTDIFTPLLGGARLVLVAEDERVDLEVLKNVIKADKVSHFIVVPAFYNIMVEEIADYLSDVKMITCAGEYFPDELIRKHFEKLPKVRIFNEYGPTENSVNTTAYELKPDSGKALIGKPISNVGVYILDRNLCLAPIGVTGEICLAGSSLARGYLNSPELTAEKFLVYYRSYRSYRSYSSPKIYKTGDLGRWLSDGNLEFSGRKDTQVKIRGIRVETGEIENCLMRHEEIKEAVVLAREGSNGENYLCAYVVGGSSGDDLKEYLSERLPGYMIPSYFMFMEAIPLLPNGKINRDVLPVPLVSPGGRAAYIAPRNWVEEKLVEIWADVLGAVADGIGIDANFFESGGNSLKAAQMAARIHRTFQVKLSLAEIFKTPFIRGIASAVSKAEETPFSYIETVEEKEFYRLSYNQRRLWIISRLEPGTAAYNMWGRVVLTDKHNVDEDRVKKVIYKIIERHESLRTGFKTVNNSPVQFVVLPQQVDIPLRRIDLSGLEENERQRRLEEILDKEVKIPFDLTRVPLCRFLLVKMAERELCMAFSMHHIVTDGLSLEILKKEFMFLYELYTRREQTGSIPGPGPIKLQYKDFAGWQDRQLSNPGVKERSHGFWRKILEKDLYAIRLPVSSQQETGTREGASYRCVITHEIKERLNRLARSNNTSLFIVMLSLFNILLTRVSGQEDILLGLPVSGRDHISLQNIVGFFVNTIILDTHVDNDIRFSEFLGKVNANVLEVLQHQAYPLEMVLDDLNMQFPPINVFFNMLNLDAGTLERELDSTDSYHTDEHIDVKFDLMVYISEYKNGIELYCNYKRAIFRPAAVSSIMERYLRVIDFFTANPGKRILDYKQAETARKKRSLRKN